jgi:AcrR family transcriptional regulator
MVDRNKLLGAALRVYADYGFRGATTRRIADEAGVNEITIFRHFGSKEALITEAIRLHGTDGIVATLPDDPSDPERELVAWCAARFTSLHQNRAMIRRATAEMMELPECAPHVMDGARAARRELEAYIDRLVSRHLLPRPDNAERGAALTMLMSAVWNDAITRELAPELYPQPLDGAPELYVRLFLRAMRS